MKWGFKRTFNCNRYQTKGTTQTQNQYFEIFFDPRFLGVRKIDVETFVIIRDFYLDVHLEDYDVKTDGRNFLDQSAKTNKENMITFKWSQMVDEILQENLSTTLPLFQRSSENNNENNDKFK